MPVIRLPESTYERLQDYANPFSDTPATVIDRLLDDYEDDNTESSGAENLELQAAKEKDDLVVIEPDSPGDLRYTKIQTASFGEKEVDGPRGPNWNRLLMVAHEIALKEFEEYKKLSQFTDTNIKQGKQTNAGYQYNANHDFSLQNKSAGAAWQDSLKLARELCLHIRVLFEWPPKEEAAYSGKTGLLEWSEENAMGE